MKNLSGIGEKMNCRNLIMTKHLAIRLCKKKQREENSQRNKYGNEEFKKKIQQKKEKLIHWRKLKLNMES